MAKVTVNHVYKIFPGEKGSSVTAVEDVNLEIADREFVVLVGPSGCGKSTTLRMIAGLEEISRGDISLVSGGLTTLGRRDGILGLDFKITRSIRTLMVLIKLDLGLSCGNTEKPRVKMRG